MRESFVFIVGKPIDEPSDVAMSLHDSLSRMASCKRKYLIKKRGRRKRGKEEKERCALYYLCFSCRGSFASSRRTHNRYRNHQYGRYMYRDAAPMSGIATPSAPIAGSAYVLATMVSMYAVMLPCFAFGYSLQKAIGLHVHDGGQRYLLPIDCYKPTCYMYLSITDRSVDMYTVHSFKNKLNLAS